MTLYIGVDFHPHQQTVSYCNTEHGEVEQISLAHNVELVRRFYEQFPKAVVGIEASCTAAWFEHLMNELRWSSFSAHKTLFAPHFNFQLFLKLQRALVT
ncbi:MAG: hypothetical protein WKF90_15760 [Pyrinomonadaceae bacterium]